MSEQDILNKLDDVLDKINDVQEKVEQVEAKIDPLINPTKGSELWIECYKCRGNGIVRNVGGMIIDVSISEYPESFEEICPICQGTKRFRWGWKLNEQKSLP